MLRRQPFILRNQIKIKEKNRSRWLITHNTNNQSEYKLSKIIFFFFLDFESKNKFKKIFYFDEK